MTTTITTEDSALTRFMDNIWLQAGIATVLTVLWLTWIFYEIFFK